MLQLKDITKDYPTGDGSSVHALRGISLDFRDNEFVAILGASGCGKTTLLNIVGGLDSYTSGDLVIGGRSTKEYKAADWDAYRNSSVGFVFQSYNLIMHQSVLSNVELALKISGCSKEDRRERAVAALEKVGLGDQIHKKPGMMSGGQMQRVAIARALVNDPDIILADEPTGALDSTTSVQIMDLLKEVAADRLVVMVTHNPELAEEYATRIVRLSDGAVVSDSNPVAASELPEGETARPKHVHLGFLTALELSANNLRTKKGRTLLTAFAGAIGIIGIALILSISNGMNAYISKMETDTMGDYPIELERETVDLSSMMDERDEEADSGDVSLMGSGSSSSTTDAGSDGTFSSNNIVAKATSTVNSLTVKNNLGAFNEYLQTHMDELDGAVNAVETTYDVTPQVFRTKADGDSTDGYVQVSPADLTQDTTANTFSSSTISSMYSSMGINVSTTSKWSQIVDDADLRSSQYQLLEGEWPTGADEVALVVSSSGEVSDFDLYEMGLLDIDDMQSLQDKVNNDESYDDPTHTFQYSDVIGREYRVFSKADFYAASDETGDTGQTIWVDKSGDSDYVATLYDGDKGTTVHVTAVLKANDSAQVSSGIAYTGALVDDLMDEAADSDVVKQQIADPTINVLTGKAFSDEKDGSSTGTTTQSSFVTSEAASTVATTTVGVYHPSDASLMHAGRATATVTSSERVISDVAPAATTEATYTVTFSGDGVTTSTQQVASGARPTVADPAKADGTPFLGWVSSADGKTYASADLPAVKADITYTASWGVSDAQLAQTLSKLTDTQRQSLLVGLMSGLTDEQKAALVKQFGGTSTDPSSLTEEQKQALIAQMMSSMTDEQKAQMLSQYAGASTAASEAAMQEYVQQYMSSLTSAEIAALMGGQSLDLSSYAGLSSLSLSTDQLEALMAQYSDSTPSTYEDVLSALGYVDRAQPSSLSIYPTDFEGKERVSTLIDEYNAQITDSANKVTYTDLVGTMTKSVTHIVDTISTVLIAFVAISLVVSSIMIAIITYISVLERTKEIGVLRALGASKGDVSKIFNAETFIEGLISGLLGIGVTLALSIPINSVVSSSLNVDNISQLSPQNAIVLIALSVVLTLIAGLIPSRLAAKKDPAVALRSE